MHHRPHGPTTAPRQRIPHFDVTPLEVMHVSQTDERPRPQRWCPVTRSCERPFEPLPSLFELTALRPEPKQRAGKFESLLGERRRRQCPFERRANVLQLYLDSLEHCS